MRAQPDPSRLALSGPMSVPCRMVHMFRAAIAGFVLLDQVLEVHECAGIAIVVVANAVAVVTSRPRRSAVVAEAPAMPGRRRSRADPPAGDR